MQERTRQKKVHINFCVSADSQRSIDNDHVKYLAALHRSGRVKLNTQPIFVYPLPARDNFDGSDFEEFSPAGDNQLDGQRFAILDGQHRWAALKSLSDEHYPSSENYRLMSVIVFDETITSEEQQYVKNFGDLNIGKKLEFNDVDLVSNFKNNLLLIFRLMKSSACAQSTVSFKVFVENVTVQQSCWKWPRSWIRISKSST